MKQKIKTITAISTTIGGSTTYISGQSTREFDNKYIPHYNTDPVHAFEFDDDGHAKEYLDKVINALHRVFNIVQLEIPVITNLRKYDREKKKAALQAKGQPVRRSFAKELITILLVTVLITSCSQYTCPSINGGKEPKDKTKRMRVMYKPLKDGTYLVTEQKGFITTTYITDCKPCR